MKAMDRPTADQATELLWWLWDDEACAETNGEICVIGIPSSVMYTPFPGMKPRKRPTAPSAGRALGAGED